MPRDLILGRFWEQFSSKTAIFREKKGSTNRFKKRCPTQCKQGTIYKPGGPWRSSHNQDCSNKKQLFEQQLKHCSNLLLKKVSWIRFFCKKLKGILKVPRNFKNSSNILLTVALKSNATIQTLVETINFRNISNILLAVALKTKATIQTVVETIFETQGW